MLSSEVAVVLDPIRMVIVTPKRAFVTDPGPVSYPLLEQWHLKSFAP